jgi:hypothetical protein
VQKLAPNSDQAQQQMVKGAPHAISYRRVIHSDYSLFNHHNRHGGSIRAQNAERQY